MWGYQSLTPTGPAPSGRSLPTPSRSSAAFSVVWANAPLPSGLVEDVQVMLPGTTTWQNVVHGSANQSATYTPAQAGSYKFRARIRNSNTGKASAYNAAHVTTVS
jgi:hypothetical protein